MAAPSTRAATALQVAAWKKRTGHSNVTAAELLNVNPRTFARWLSGVSTSPKSLGDFFRAGAK